MINCVIKANSIDELNQEIIKFNKGGWVVKQIYAINEHLSKYTTTVYALLESQGGWK